MEKFFKVEEPFIMLKTRLHQSGQSLFEVIISLSVIALVLSATLGLSSRTIKTSASSRDNAQATALSREALEWVRQERDSNWNTFYTNYSTSAGKRYCVNTLNWSTVGTCSSTITNTIYKREVVLDRVTVINADDSIDVTVTVFWTDSSGDHTVVNQTRFTQWQN